LVDQCEIHKFCRSEEHETNVQIKSGTTIGTPPAVS